MKKLSSIMILSFFMTTIALNPVWAILDKKDKKIIEEQEQKESVLKNINYDWWKEANDSYLENYILRAIEYNHDIKTAQLNIEQAQINVTMTRANQLPSVGIGAAPAIAKLPDSKKTTGSFAFPLYASYELDLFGKNADKTKSSKVLLDSVEYQTKAAEIATVSLVGSIYYNIVKLDKIIEIQEKIAKDRAEIYRLMNLSYKAGLASAQDTIQSEKASIMAQNDLIEYQKNLTNALRALAVLIGDSPENIEDYKRISYDELSSEFNIPNEISSEIIVNRPDYKSQESQLKAAGIDIKVAKKEFLPTIDILGAVAFLATSQSSSMNWESALSLLGANAALPLFTGFRKTANLKLNKNKYSQILEQYQKTNLVAIQEVNDSLYNFRSDSEKLTNNIKALDMQKQDYNLASSKFDQGTISKLELLQQKESLLFMEQLAIGSKMDCYIDKIVLYKTTGAQI